uniref:Uncharacterized protein n=1 Tax=Glossina morsitans morsitans TaxID=37546 RepID=A0A1B0G5X4_GLOMM
MQPFIVVRNYREDDELKCQELVRDYIMSFFKKSFYCFCFREITLQFIVITWAILFIFLGVPLTFCALCVPGCIFFLFSGTYFSFYAKAVELMKTKPNQALVAECYEPYIFRLKPNEVTYQIFMDDAPYEPSFKNKFRKKVNFLNYEIICVFISTLHLLVLRFDVKSLTKKSLNFTSNP